MPVNDVKQNIKRGIAHAHAHAQRYSAEALWR